MKKALSILTLVALVTVAFASFSVVRAEETKMVGVISKIELAADGKAATTTLKDSKTAAEVVIVVEDEMTLDKFKDKRIVEGDEIRVKYDVIDRKNVSKYFRKTAGC
jgi:hypothetical protein